MRQGVFCIVLSSMEVVRVENGYTATEANKNRKGRHKSK